MQNLITSTCYKQGFKRSDHKIENPNAYYQETHVKESKIGEV